jgi:hypothetical protein
VCKQSGAPAIQERRTHAADTGTAAAAEPPLLLLVLLS